jgi:hypothetical protein
MVMIYIGANHLKRRPSLRRGNERSPIMAKTVFIVGAGNDVARLSYDTASNKFKTTEFEPSVDGSVKGNVRINALAVVNHTLRQLKEGGLFENKEIQTIYTVGLVTDMIHKGTIKFWLNSDGKKFDGSDVNEVEMGLWNEFIALYMENFTKIVIRNIKDAQLPEYPKFKPSQEDKNLDKLQKMVWLMVKPVEVPMTEAEGEASGL